MHSLMTFLLALWLLIQLIGYDRSCTKVRSNVGTLERDDGSFTETDYEAANVLNSFLPVCSLMSPYLTSQVYLTSLMEKI